MCFVFIWNLGFLVSAKVFWLFESNKNVFFRPKLFITIHIQLVFLTMCIVAMCLVWLLDKTLNVGCCLNLDQH